MAAKFGFAYKWHSKKKHGDRLGHICRIYEFTNGSNVKYEFVDGVIITGRRIDARRIPTVSEGEQHCSA